MSGVEVSVVVTCYKSGQWLEQFVDEIVGVAKSLASNFEVILVNDASPDAETWAAIQKLSSRYPFVKGIDLLRNVGQFRALRCGLSFARGDIVVTIDDDYQHPPGEIPTLVNALRAAPDMDVIIGAYEDKKHSLFRNLGSRLVGLIYRRAYGKPPDLEMTSFRALRAPVVSGMLQFGTSRPVPGAQLLATTNRICNVTVRHDDRQSGESGYGIGRLLSSTVDTLIHGTTAPLRLLSLVGGLAAVSSFLIAGVYLSLWIFSSAPVAGFTTLVLLVVFFGGMSLLSIGVLGEYVARVVGEVVQEPEFLVREQTR